ncbi:hypothetical protein ACF0H5_021383 [Mactra antiquata]
MDWTFVILIVLRLLQLSYSTQQTLVPQLNHVDTESKIKANTFNTDIQDGKSDLSHNNIKHLTSETNNITPKKTKHVQHGVHHIPNKHHRNHKHPKHILLRSSHTNQTNGLSYKNAVSKQKKSYSYSKHHSGGLAKRVKHIDIHKTKSKNAALLHNDTNQSKGEVSAEKKVKPDLFEVIGKLIKATEFLRKSKTSLTLPTTTTSSIVKSSIVSTSTLSVTNTSPWILEIEEADRLSHDMEQELEVLSKFDTTTYNDTNHTVTSDTIVTYKQKLPEYDINGNKPNRIQKREIRAKGLEDIDYDSSIYPSDTIQNNHPNVNDLTDNTNDIDDDETDFKRDLTHDDTPKHALNKMMHLSVRDLHDLIADNDDDDFDDDDDVEVVAKMIDKSTYGKRASHRNIGNKNKKNGLKSNTTRQELQKNETSTSDVEKTNAKEDLKLLQALSKDTLFLHKKPEPPKPSLKAVDKAIVKNVDEIDKSNKLKKPNVKKPPLITVSDDDDDDDHDDHDDEDDDDDDDGDSEKDMKIKPTSKVYKEFKELNKPYITPTNSETNIIANAVLWIGVGVGTAFSAIMFILCCSFYRCLFKYRNDKAQDDLGWSSEEEVFDVTSVKQLKKVSVKKESN